MISDLSTTFSLSRSEDSIPRVGPEHIPRERHPYNITSTHKRGARCACGHIWPPDVTVRAPLLHMRGPSAGAGPVGPIWGPVEHMWGPRARVNPLWVECEVAGDGMFQQLSLSRRLSRSAPKDGPSSILLLSAAQFGLHGTDRAASYVIADVTSGVL